MQRAASESALVMNQPFLNFVSLSELVLNSNYESILPYVFLLYVQCVHKLQLFYDVDMETFGAIGMVALAVPSIPLK